MGQSVHSKLAFVDEFERPLVGQGGQRRSIEETLDRYRWVAPKA